MGLSNINIDKPEGFFKAYGTKWNEFDFIISISVWVIHSSKTLAGRKDGVGVSLCLCVAGVVLYHRVVLCSWVCVLKWNDNERDGNAVNMLKEIKKKKERGKITYRQWNTQRRAKIRGFHIKEKNMLFGTQTRRMQRYSYYTEARGLLGDCLL